MTGEAHEPIISPTLPTISQQKKRDNGLLASKGDSQKSRRPLNEKIIYRKSGLPNLNELADTESVYDHAECPRCHSVISVKLRNKSGLERSATTCRSRKCVSREHLLPNNKYDDAVSLISNSESRFDNHKIVTPLPQRQEQRKYLKKGKLYRSVDEGVNWNDLNEKIEDWFEGAKTPDQKVVYHFLNELKQEDETSSVYSEKVPNKVKSLEGILDNLKKYRNKLHDTNSGLPQLDKNGRQKNLDNLFESSTWRVMRHIRSADIRNKYPLPKANPDKYFRNSTVFHVAGRVPNSTFLIHPEWV